VEHGLITEGDLRELVFAKSVRLRTAMNPDFFKGTVVEGRRRGNWGAADLTAPACAAAREGVLPHLLASRLRPSDAGHAGRGREQFHYSYGH
jgi:hypothetical protein